MSQHVKWPNINSYIARYLRLDYCIPPCRVGMQICQVNKPNNDGRACRTGGEECPYSETLCKREWRRATGKRLHHSPSQCMCDGAGPPPRGSGRRGVGPRQARQERRDPAGSVSTRHALWRRRLGAAEGCRVRSVGEDRFPHCIDSCRPEIVTTLPVHDMYSCLPEST